MLLDDWLAALFVTPGLTSIRDYCETDVVNTYLVYCRFQKMRGELDMYGATGDFGKLLIELAQMPVLAARGISMGAARQFGVQQVFLQAASGPADARLEVELADHDRPPLGA